MLKMIFLIWIFKILTLLGLYNLAKPYILLIISTLYDMNIFSIIIHSLIRKVDF